jgi:RNA-directed DNA polymerase
MKGFESNTTCDKTLQLIRKLLKAGYNDCNSGEHIQTILGIPPSVYSSLLTNILLNELDKKVLDLKNSFEKGKKRARNKEYDALTSRIQSLNKLQPGFNIITKERAIKRRSNPSLTASETNLRRLMYIRYADDFVILIKGTIDDAKHIKHLIADILTKKCGLDLHDDNTLITATKEGFKFLGA